MFDAQRERDDALANEAMTQGEYTRMAVNQYAAAHGEHRVESAWILSPFDTWERNPFYVGPAQPHPEDDYADAEVDEDGWTDELEAQMLSEPWDEIPF